MHEDVWHFVGHEVAAEDLRLIREVVGTVRGDCSVCELLAWTRPTGRLKDRECRAFLERLELAGELTLPGKRIGRPVGSRTRVPVTARGEAQAGIAGTVRDVAPIVTERVDAADDRLLFRELVGRHHYLGHALPFGAHLRYLVYASQPQRRVVACVQFSSPAWRMASRDAWIGWDDATRARHLPLVVNNSRFLILPWVRVRNLTSTVLSRVARRLATDWTARYGATPVLLETLVDPARFDGASYRAANWIVVGETTGGGSRRAGARSGHRNGCCCTRWRRTRPGGCGGAEQWPSPRRYGRVGRRPGRWRTRRSTRGSTGLRRTPLSSRRCWRSASRSWRRGSTCWQRVWNRGHAALRGRIGADGGGVHVWTRAAATAGRRQDDLDAARTGHAAPAVLVLRRVRDGFHPQDATLQLSGKHHQYDIQDRSTRVGAELPFGVGAEQFERLTVVPTSPHFIHETLNAVGDATTLERVLPRC